MRWLLVLACLGCSSKKQDCVPVKATVVQRDAGVPDPVRAQVDEDLRTIDRELECPRLGKASAPDLVPIQSALLTLKGRAVPQAVGEALQPVIALYDENQGLLSGPSPKIEAWCKEMRVAVAKAKRETSPLWTTAPEPVLAAPAACR